MIAECLGDGDAFEGKGCSDRACTVHRAFWNRSAAAVKIIRGRSTEQEVRARTFGSLGEGGPSGRQPAGRSHIHRRNTARKPGAAKGVTAIPRPTTQALLDATQMAVMSSVTHPNLVKAFVCLTDVVECGEGALSFRLCSACARPGRLPACRVARSTARPAPAPPLRTATAAPRRRPPSPLSAPFPAPQMRRRACPAGPSAAGP